MRRPPHLVSVLTAAALALSATFVTGCKGEDASATAQPAAAEVDPRFATAEALCEYFNQLESMGRDAGPVFVDMLYAETPWQEDYLASEQNRIRVHQLEEAMHSRFGVSIRGDAGNLFYTPLYGPAVIEETQPQRATARFEKEGMPPSAVKLYLVKAKGRWWISSYTFEYVYTGEAREQVRRDQLIFAPMAAAADEVMPALQAGRYQSAEEAQVAFRTAMQRHALDYPELFWDE